MAQRNKKRCSHKNKIIHHPVHERKKKLYFTSASILHSFLLNLEAQFSKGSRRWRPNPLFVIHLLHPPKCRCGATHTIFYIFSCVRVTSVLQIHIYKWYTHISIITQYMHKKFSHKYCSFLCYIRLEDVLRYIEIQGDKIRVVV